MTPNWTPTKPGEYWLSLPPKQRTNQQSAIPVVCHPSSGILAAAILLGLVVLCALASLPGCATPSKLRAEALRMDALGQAAERACGSACSQRQIACAKATASALRAISEALRVQATATKYTTGALAPDVSAAIKTADEECKP